MNKVLGWAFVFLTASVSGMLWAFPYRQDHPMEAVGAFFGATDPTYAMAGWVAGIGVLVFIVGIGLLIAGLVSSASPQIRLAQQTDGGPSLDQSERLDRAKWNALLQYDKDVAAAAEKVKPFGSKWVDEFAASFLALNDKQYLPDIVEKITARAKSEEAENEKLRAREAQRQEERRQEQARYVQLRKEQFLLWRNRVWGTKEKRRWTSGIILAVIFGLVAMYARSELDTMKIRTKSGLIIRVHDFVDDGEAYARYGYYYLGYHLVDGVPDNSAPFVIQYIPTSQSFDVGLLQQPIGQTRLQAEQYLMSHLGISRDQMCDLDYQVAVPGSVDPTFAGNNLGFSFCPGATALP